MASSLLESSIGRAAKAAKDHVNGSLEKVRERPRAIQLGKALETSSKVVGATEDFVPGAKLIGGALSFGAPFSIPKIRWRICKRSSSRFNRNQTGKTVRSSQGG